MRIDHVGLAVSDSQRSVAFYRRVVEAVVAGVWEDDSLRLTFLQVGGMTIELVEHIGGDASPRSPGPVDHIAFSVEDMEKTLAAAREAGARDLLPAPKVMEKKTIMFVAGPDGEKIEFVWVKK